MRITKFTHACVRLDDGDRALLVDPGVWSSAEVYDGIDEVLVTHEHADHIDLEALTVLAGRNSALQVHAPVEMLDQLVVLGGLVRPVRPGEAFVAGGFDVAVVGGRHADIYDGLPGCANVGYVVDGSVYHPGDSYFVPDVDVDTLLVPTSGPWWKLTEAIDFVRAVAPTRAISIHDALLNDLAAGVIDRWMGMTAQTDYSRVQVGAAIDV
jgi:L-ascorbate metabolism protein UlaG (beta-lactamase superfamily)